MPTLTKAAYIKANETMKNNFKFDAHYYCLWGEKRARKNIELPNGHYLEIDIEYNVKARVSYSDPVSYVLDIHFQEWEPLESGCARSDGCGHNITISEGHAKKMFNKIQAETANWPDAKCIEEYNKVKNEQPEKSIFFA